MRIVSVDNLTLVLTENMTWRIREISDLKRTVSLVPNSFRSSVIRATVPLIYAHWEGHVRLCASAYADYVSARRLSYRSLHRGYMLGALKGELDQIARKGASRIDLIRFLERLDEIELKHFRSRGDRLIETRSNLSFEVLTEISAVIGIDASVFEADATFINKILLDRRNHIAHGQEVILSDDDLDGIANRTVGLMRTFQNLVENAALNGRFERQGRPDRARRARYVARD